MIKASIKHTRLPPETHFRFHHHPLHSSSDSLSHPHLPAQLTNLFTKMDPSTLPVDIFVTSLQFTKNTYQDIYPAIDPTLPSLSLAGKVVIVTGASRGIGRHGIVPAIAKAGAKGLVLVGTNHDLLVANEAKVHEINPAIKTLSVATEISDPKAVANLFAQVASTFGHADVLVHSAAIGVGNGKFHEEEPATWWKNFVSPNLPPLVLSFLEC